MKRNAPWLIVLILLSPLVAAREMPTPAPQGFEPVVCVMREGSILVKFGTTKHPTYFGVLTPGDHFVYLRYPPRGIDVLGERYHVEPIELDISTLMGVRMVDGEMLPAKAFPEPGTYRLHFQDANTALGIDLHQMQCTVTIGKTFTDLRSPSDDPTCEKPRRLSRSREKESAMVGCFTGTCGYYPCCYQSFPGQPCYCSPCCIAEPQSGTGSAVARAE